MPRESTEEHIDQPPFQATQGRLWCLALGPFLRIVRSAAQVAAALGQRDDVDGPIELPVATPIEAIAAPPP